MVPCIENGCNVETDRSRRTNGAMSPRRVRVHFGGVRVADSARTMLLRQHGFLPVYYFPAEDVRTDLLVTTDYTTRSPYKGTASYWHLRTPDRTARNSRCGAIPAAQAGIARHPRTTTASTGTAWTRGTRRTNGSMYTRATPCCAWTPCAPHAGCGSRSAARSLRNRGARCCSSRPVWSPATTCPRPTCGKTCCARARRTPLCPYKGRARYHHLELDGARYEDIAWQYVRPLPSILAVAGHLAFWNEREDTTIYVDGEPISSASARERAGTAASCCLPPASSGASLPRPR